MSIFSDILCKINELSSGVSDKINDDLQNAFDVLDKWNEEYVDGKSKRRETQLLRGKNAMTTLQSIHEDEDDTFKTPDSQTKVPKRKSSQKTTDVVEPAPTKEPETTRARKRSKDEVDHMPSPTQEKRPKRNASVKALTNISQQVNVNLTHKLRRDRSSGGGGRRGRAGSDKENEADVVKVKQEKLSVPPEPMDTAPPAPPAAVKLEADAGAMPPPAAPLPKARGRPPKEKRSEADSGDSVGGRRSTRSRRQPDAAPPTAAVTRSTRSSRASSRGGPPPAPPAPRAPRPRTKKASATTDDSQDKASQDSGTNSPAPEKTRPKRTKRGKAKTKESDTQQDNATSIDKTAKREPSPEPIAIIPPKEERISEQQATISSPILHISAMSRDTSTNDPEKTRVLEPVDRMDRTVVLSSQDEAPKKDTIMDETVVLERARTPVAGQAASKPLDATVVLDKGAPSADLTDDNSLLTDDSDRPGTPPRAPPPPQPTSAVKEKVQKFEELASRVTRTKTRAMAKTDEAPENSTPPDKVMKPILSAETLTKMNSLIFNGKPQPQISSSASKPRANLPVAKSVVPSSASKLTAGGAGAGAGAARREEESREDARRKKEALLEAKKEAQRRKREEKMAAARDAREAAERGRRAALQCAGRERLEREAAAELSRAERLREAERKKQELARKAAETEERRRAEERARQQRLAEEQRRADQLRRKHNETQEAMKKEAAFMAKEYEKRQKEYLEKQKMKQRMDAERASQPGTPLAPPPALPPVHMADGFQYLNSDEEDEETAKRPVPEWSTPKARFAALCVQAAVRSPHVDRLFSVRVHSPDLRAIFPNIDRRALKRTSSAVWRTPPNVKMNH